MALSAAAVVMVVLLVVVSQFPHCAHSRALPSQFFLHAAAAAAADMPKIGSFNVQVFGVTKMSKPDVVKVIVDIVRRYDIFAIQEIRDASGEAIIDLVNQVNAGLGDPYSWVVGPRLGRTSSKEQYAYLYKGSKFTLSETHTYSNPSDIMARPPLFALFEHKSTQQRFVLCSNHITPDDVIAEVDVLPIAYNEIVELWGESKVLILGDMNTGCSYLSASAFGNLDLSNDQRFAWLFNSSVGTAVITGCPYDKFVASSSILQHVVPTSVSVFKFDKEYNLNDTFAKTVSDHYPIELSLDFTPPTPITCAAVTTNFATFNAASTHEVVFGECTNGHAAWPTPPVRTCETNGQFSPQVVTGGCRAVATTNRNATLSRQRSLKL